MRGRSLPVSYSLAATERASPLAGNSLFASRIFILTSSDISRVLKRQHRKPIKDFAAPRTNGQFSIIDQMPDCSVTPSRNINDGGGICQKRGVLVRRDRRQGEMSGPD